MSPQKTSTDLLSTKSRKMLSWCTSCIRTKKEANNCDHQEESGGGGNDNKIELTPIDQIALLDHPHINLECKNKSLDPAAGVILQEPIETNSLDRLEEDSGTCVDASNSSAEMLDNIDKAQLTVSSVNSILPDLPEQEDYDDDEEINATDEKPLLPSGESRFLFVFHLKD